MADGMENNGEKSADAAAAVAGIGATLGIILASTQALVKLATELKPLHETVVRHRDMSIRQLDVLNGSVDKQIAAFGRYDETCKRTGHSLDEAARAYSDNAAVMRDLAELLNRTIDAMPALVAKQVEEALARAGIASGGPGLH